MAKNFLLGNGELLTKPIPPPKGPPPAPPPRTVQEARERLVPMVGKAVEDMEALPPKACPGDQTVAMVTLHPEYVAKSYHPGGLLRAVDIEPVGSRPSRVKPEVWKKKREPEESVTTDLFVAGTRAAFKQLKEKLGDLRVEMVGEKNVVSLEEFRLMTAEDRVFRIPVNLSEPLLEIVLHATPERDWIVDGFAEYAKDFDAELDLDRMFYAGGLCFMPVRAERKTLSELARFSFIRAMRVMPKLRRLQPIPRSVLRRNISCVLPQSGPMDSDLRVAVLDGGLPDNHPFGPWVQARDLPGIGAPVAQYQDHGAAVTSALLFGSVPGSGHAPQPYAAVDHFRVLDDKSDQDPVELYDVLHRVLAALQSGQYTFANLSVGPDLPIEDHEVHGWTAALDEVLSDGTKLMTVAVGNTGEMDEASGNARVQVPSDCVNALAVGASDGVGKKWSKASYSSIGPGRSPGIVKPDVLAFGGSDNELFLVVDASRPSRVLGTSGTSFASPAALRMALAIRAHFGSRITPLGLKALVVHASEEHSTLERKHVGWGRIPEEIDTYVVCPAGTARVLYQGELTPSQYIRAQIPLPTMQLTGNVMLRATFTFTTETDPQDPSNYTRSGLDIVFRPHETKFDKKTGQVKTRAFFQRKDFSTEEELRYQAHKWETTLHKEICLRGSSLKNPVFDIHYNARESGGPAHSATKIRYALVVSVVAKKVPDLYDHIVQRYPTQLRPLTPVIQIPVRT